MNQVAKPETVSREAILSQSAQRAPSSEATHIEQSRAIAQVQGALIVAQQRPRDEMKAMDRVRATCEIEALAERAFFRFPRGGTTVTGPTIHLATELARCWGNIDFGINELRRDDIKGESEMLAVAWDLETNTRVTNSFMVPHRRDKRGGPEALTDMRDIYENNANNGARRLRECLFRVLPTHVIEEAKTICGRTLADGGGVPHHERVEKLLEAFAGIGVTRNQVEKKTGIDAAKMTPVDIANLRVIFASIKRGEINIADEFPPDRADEIGESLRAGAEKEPEPEPEPEKETKAKTTKAKEPEPHDPETGEVTESEAEPVAEPDNGDFVDDFAAGNLADIVHRAPPVGKDGPKYKEWWEKLARPDVDTAENTEWLKAWQDDHERIITDIETMSAKNGAVIRTYIAARLTELGKARQAAE